MATYYISPTGNDTTGTGTYASPWLTLGKANTSSTTGDTIFCKNGSYTMETVVFVGRTIYGESVGGVTFSGGGSAYMWSLAGTSVVENIRITGVNTTGSVIKFSSDNSNVTFKKFQLDTCVHTGTQDANNCIINGRRSNSVYKFIGCLFYGINMTAGTKVMFTSYGGTADTLGFYNCTFALNKIATPSDLDEVVLFSPTNSNLTVKNCIVYSYSSSYKLTFLYGSLGTGSTASYTYSCFYNMNASISGTGNLNSTDPLFTDATNNIFSLKPTSPCLSVGNLL